MPRTGHESSPPADRCRITAELLAAVGRQGVMSPTEAVDRTAMDKVKVSRAAASLVSRGLLRQSRDPEDGRGRWMDNRFVDRLWRSLKY